MSNRRKIKNNKNQINILISYKAKILNELKNGKSREFYKNCYMKNHAFDVVVDNMKFEIHPYGLDYWRGAEAVNLKEDLHPIDFTDEELHEVFVQN